MSKQDYLFYKKHRKDIADIQMLVDILECFRRGYFHYSEPITLLELKKIAFDTQNTYYKEFTINKRHGGKRLISAPTERLKEIQNCIRLLLIGPAFRGQSITDCAAPHINQDVVYNIDIKDFYPSINVAQIVVKLLENGFKYDVAQLLSLLVTMRSKNGTPVLPQGAPSSPAISNLVVEHLDARLSGFASKHGINYSRYVDDITFSCSRSKPWYIYSGFFKKIIQSEGFEINDDKCHVSFSYQRQEVLGLTVNKRLNVTQKYIKQLRTILHNWEKDGYIKANNNLLLHYFKDMINPQTSIPRMESIVAGKLSYLKMVRNVKFTDENSPLQAKEVIDPVWKKFHDRYVALRKRDYSIITGNNTNRRFGKRVYRYGDAVGPLVFAERESFDSPWIITRVQNYNGIWFNGDEKDAYCLRYGCYPDY